MNNLNLISFVLLFIVGDGQSQISFGMKLKLRNEMLVFANSIHVNREKRAVQLNYIRVA